MATSVDWSNKIINVLRADMTLVQTTPTEIRSLDLNSFRKDLKDLEDGEEGMSFLDTHTHNTTSTLGGVTLARVIEIINGYTVTFEDGAYAVNLVGANSNVGDVTNVNQVSIRSTNSAGLVDLEVLLASAYQGVVVVSTTKGQAGTDTPIGTYKEPSNNMVDALAIAEIQGIRAFFFLEDMTLYEDYSEGFIFEGVSPFTTLTVDPAAVVINCSMNLLTLQGELDGLSTVRECSVGSVTGASGFFEKCAFQDGMVLGGTLNCLDCFSQKEGSGYPTLTVGSHALIVRDHRGSLGIIGATAGHISSVGLGGGRLLVDATSVGGTVHARGTPYDIVDSSAVGCTVLDETESMKVRNVALEVPYIERGVHVDTDALTQGIGTQARPFNTLEAALDFAELNNYRLIHVLSDITLDRNVKNFIVSGVGLPSVDCNGQNVDRTRFDHCTLRANYTGFITVQECALADGVTLNGYFEKCAILGNLVSAPLANIDMIGCVSTVRGLGYPTLSGVDGSVSIRGHQGSLGLVGFTGGVHSIGLYEGRLLIDNTCTGSEIHARGLPFDIVDTSAVGCTVIDATESKKTASDTRESILGTESFP